MLSDSRMSATAARGSARHHEAMPSGAALAGRQPGGHVGPFGRQPAHRVLRERGITQTSLCPVVGRSSSVVSGVLNGFWAPDTAFVRAVSDHLALPKDELFSSGLLEASMARGEPRLAHIAQARRARVGRLGRQPAYWILRQRGIHHAEICRLTGQSSGYVSMVLNGSMAPTPSFVNAVVEFLGLTSAELFTDELIEAVRGRIAGLGGPPPSRRAGPHGRQPAYWLLRERGIRQTDLGAVLGRTGGHVSQVLNGFVLADRPFVEAVNDALGLAPSELFTDQVLRAIRA